MGLMAAGQPMGVRWGGRFRRGAVGRWGPRGWCAGAGGWRRLAGHGEVDGGAGLARGCMEDDRIGGGAPAGQWPMVLVLVHMCADNGRIDAGLVEPPAEYRDSGRVGRREGV